MKIAVTGGRAWRLMVQHTHYYVGPTEAIQMLRVRYHRLTGSAPNARIALARLAREIRRRQRAGELTC